MNETIAEYLASQVDAGDASDAAGDVPWNRVVKLLVISVIATVASTGNVFVISAVLMDDHLKKRGNVFVVNIAVADMVVTGLAIPAATVGLLANFNDWQFICQIQWSCVLLTCLVTAPSAAAAAADARLQIGVGPDRYMGLVTFNRLAVILLIIWVSSAAGLLTILMLRLGPDICHTVATDVNSATPQWSWPLPLAIMAVQVLWPVLLTLLIHFCSSLILRSSKSPPFLATPYDGSLLRTNIATFLLFVVCWTPLMVALSSSYSSSSSYSLASSSSTAAAAAAAAADPSGVTPPPPTPMQHLEWVAMAKSCLNPFVYAACNKHFRESFVSLFHYCCCKTSVSFSRRVRADSLRPASDVRVHIIPGYNVYSAVTTTQHRATSSNHHAAHLQQHHMNQRAKTTKMSSATSKKPTKEVYEL